MVRVAPKPSLREASCCRVEVVKGGCGWRLTSLRSIVDTLNARAPIASTAAVVGPGRDVDLGDGYFVREIPVPHHLVGNSLAGLAVRERTGVQVLMLRHPGRGGAEAGPMRIPTASEVLESGDTLVVAGTEKALARLEAL